MGHIDVMQAPKIRTDLMTVPDGELRARHFATGHPVYVQWRKGIITELDALHDEEPTTLWLAEGLVDLQVNGYAGVDFQQDELTVQDLEKAAQALRRDGCTRFLLTLITDEWGVLLKRLQHIRSLRAQSPYLQQAIAGWHIEGPFLSEKPGFHGAHDPALMLDPTAEHLNQLREITGRDPVLITVAPERAGAIEAIKHARSLGFTVSLGHTDASAEVLRVAVEAGANAFTHLGNGCPRELDRHDNILWRVFETPGLTASLIPDGHHVSPALFRLVHCTLPARQIYYTTDAMSAAGAPPGKYPLGKVTLEVGADQIVRLPGKTNFAGSALRPIDGVSRAAEMLGCPWQEVWERFSETPAKLIGLPLSPSIGQPMGFCILES